MNHFRYRVAILFSVAILSFVAGILVTKLLTASYLGADRGKIIRQTTEKFISPILSCEIGPETDFTELKPIRYVLDQYIKQATADHLADNVSVYFRLMNTGRWLTINKEDLYTPSSLYKAIVLLAYYKEAETNPGILNRSIKYVSDGSVDYLYGGVREDLVSGGYYTINELLNYMITKSYNSAMRTLIDYSGPTIFSGVASNLSLPLAKTNSQEEAGVISAMDYSLIFRVLFGASYLDREMSQRALELLSKTDFNDGLRAGVPPEVEISHKFGIHTSDPTVIGSAEQLHDCGIVYFPRHPYLLCVMTKGQHKQDLARVLAGVSKTAYAGVTDFFKQ